MDGKHIVCQAKIHNMLPVFDVDYNGLFGVKFYKIYFYWNFLYLNYYLCEFAQLNIT